MLALSTKTLGLLAGLLEVLSGDSNHQVPCGSQTSA